MDVLPYIDFTRYYYQATNLPVSIFDRKQLLAQGAHHIKDFNLPMLLMECLPNELPDLWYTITPEQMIFGGIAIPGTEGYFCIGPVMAARCSHSQATAILSAIGRTSKDLSAMTHLFSQYAFCTVKGLLANLRILFFTMNKVPNPPIEKITFHWKTLFPNTHFQAVEFIEPPSTDITDVLLSFVKYGKVKELNEYLDKNVMFQLENEYQISNVSAMHTILLGANMLIGHTASEAGVNKALANELISLYNEQITKCSDYIDLNYLFQQMIQDFTKRVAQVKRITYPSLHVQQVCNYVYSHLYEKITPTVLAEVIHITESYLCAQFKKTTGKTITNFIQECKIEEACRLLESSPLKYSEISDLLCFSSQSYFCTIFKKIMHQTPEQYRMNYLSSLYS